MLLRCCSTRTANIYLVQTPSFRITAGAKHYAKREDLHTTLCRAGRNGGAQTHCSTAAAAAQLCDMFEVNLIFLTIATQQRTSACLLPKFILGGQSVSLPLQFAGQRKCYRLPKGKTHPLNAQEEEQVPDNGTVYKHFLEMFSKKAHRPTTGRRQANSTCTAPAEVLFRVCLHAPCLSSAVEGEERVCASPV